MKGRKPTPTKLKLLMGNPGKQKIPQGEPEPETKIPDPPAMLTDYALEEWHRITPALADLGLISELTVPAVIAYCDSYSDWRTATEELNKIRRDKSALATLIQLTTNGNIIPNPLKLMQKSARADFVRFAAEFGGTEVAKTRLATESRTRKSKFDGLLCGRR